MGEFLIVNLQLQSDARINLIVLQPYSKRKCRLAILVNIPYTSITIFQ